MHIIFPEDYFYSKKPDLMLQDQANAFIGGGFKFGTVNLDNWKIFNGQPQDKVLYRGWMLNENDYKLLLTAFKNNNMVPYVNLEDYLAAHYLPNWYPLIKDLTPETVVFPVDGDLKKELQNLAWEKFFIKDYVKSLKTSVGSIINSAAQINSLLAEMLKFRGTIEGGICVRKVESFIPETEKRYFSIEGIVYAANAKDIILDVAQECAKRIKSNFFAIDVVKTKKGKERIVEVGDGQVSDIIGWEPARLAEILGYHFLEK